MCQVVYKDEHALPVYFRHYGTPTPSDPYVKNHLSDEIHRFDCHWRYSVMDGRENRGVDDLSRGDGRYVVVSLFCNGEETAVDARSSVPAP